MNHFKIIFICFFPAFLIPCCSSGIHKEPQRFVPAIPDDTCSIEQASRIVSKGLMTLSHDYDTASFEAFYRVLDTTARMILSITPSHAAPQACADSIISTVYERWGIRFDPRDTAIETLLPHLVYKYRKGACLGVSLILLMLAEKTGCPLYGVILPGHFFCRYDDTRTRFNIEPNRSGVCHPDDYYKSRYPVTGMPWYDLGNLQAKGSIGVLCYNAGSWCLNHRQYTAAIAYFRETTKRLGSFAEAQGNCALAYARSGRLDTAMSLFGSLFQSHPDLNNCAVNFGAVAIAAKRYETAKEIFLKGLEFYPNDTTLLAGLRLASEKLGNAGPRR